MGFWNNYGRKGRRRSGGEYKYGIVWRWMLDEVTKVYETGYIDIRVPSYIWYALLYMRIDVP